MRTTTPGLGLLMLFSFTANLYASEAKAGETEKAQAQWTLELEGIEAYSKQKLPETKFPASF